MNRECFLLILMLIFVFPFKVKGDIVTNRKRTDGFGSQLEEIVYTAVYAELTNNTFVYTPITEMEHNYDNDPSFLKKKEWLMNICRYVPINTDLALYERCSRHHVFRFFHDNIEKSARSISVQKIKEYFRANKNPGMVFQKARFNIAMHVRRPNRQDIRIYGPDIPDDDYINILKKLRSRYNNKNPLFHICSQGDIEDFKKKFPGDDIELCINASIEETFMKMVFSDVLVSTASALSYVAGWLSEGEVYYIPFQDHEPFPWWINVKTLMEDDL